MEDKNYPPAPEDNTGYYIVIDYYDGSKIIYPVVNRELAQRTLTELLKYYGKTKITVLSKNTIIHNVVDNNRTKAITLQKSSFNLIKTTNNQLNYALL